MALKKLVIIGLTCFNGIPVFLIPKCDQNYLSNFSLEKKFIAFLCRILFENYYSRVLIF
ncbi:hypothetical protein BpHYR1_005619 [Brachionus plicatilis]|uniref:Uncharacterized protein n=1 Tax=Brachionus plicatilis TaxID=10195 RepID=A0A3M7PJM4_BRAPC|nr:hypothetical protein BpHYR1_005619 [Brachionus plicatilis]